MTARRTPRPWDVGLFTAGGLLLLLALPTLLSAGESPQVPAAPTVPTATDFAFPMKAWRRGGIAFGSTWRFARCSKCRKTYTHVGEDVNFGHGFVRYRVYATEAGIVRQAFSDGRWAWCVVIEHTLKGGKNVTSVCWHLSKPSVKVGQVVKRGQVIGRLADLGRNTHLHFGIRRAPFHRVLSCKGALPSCTHSKAQLPRFPEKFTHPTKWIRSR